MFLLDHAVAADSCLATLLNWTVGILTLLNWIAGILTNGDEICPKELLLNRSTSPCPIYCLFSPTVRQWATRGSKHLRTLIKSRF